MRIQILILGFKGLILILWIVIYPVYRALQHLNNLGHMSFFCSDSRNVTLLAQGYYGATDGKRRTFEKVTQIC